MRQSILLTTFILFFFATPSFAQYKPLVETPLDAVSEGFRENQAQPSNIKEGDIQFDPEKGIILPDSAAQKADTDSDGNINVKKRHESYLISEIEKEKSAASPTEVEDPEKTYIDRQIDKQFGEMKGYVDVVGTDAKKGISFIFDKILFVISVIKDWPIVKNPPPIFLSFPLFCVLYFLTCYPLVKIGRTITNQEWMGWVPVLQLVLLLRITERSMWTLLVFIIPVANIIFIAIIFMEICDMFRIPAWYGVFILVPGINIALLWYLAYVEFE